MMRRKEKEITDRSVMEEIIGQAQVCHLGLADGDQPYMVPMNFGYRDGTLYLHGALEGRKMEILRRNPKVCVAFDIHARVLPAENACKWGVRFQSVIAFGKAVILEDPVEKTRGLDVIMAHYSERSHTYPDKALAATAVIRIAVDTMTGKQSGFPSRD